MNKPVHGFAVTDPKKMSNCPFYCVDSTTWLSTVRFGESHIFNGHTIEKKRSVKLKAKVGKMPELCQLKSDSDRVRESIEAFVQAERFLTRLWKERGFDTKEIENKLRSIYGEGFLQN